MELIRYGSKRFRYLNYDILNKLMEGKIAMKEPYWPRPKWTTLQSKYKNQKNTANKRQRYTMLPHKEEQVV